MIAVLSDTHRRDDPGLTGRTLDAVRSADLVIHAGDFTAEPVLDRLESLARSVVAVHGNADDQAVRDRVPAVRAVDWNGVRIAVTHRGRSGSIGLRLFGVERDADLVVYGHTHRPAVTEAGSVTLLNPGSPTRPRGGPPTHAELTTDGSRIHIGIYRPNGARIRSTSVAIID